MESFKHWRYQAIKTLGFGSSGQVFLARDLAGGKTVAVKTASGDHAVLLQREFIRMKKLRHPLLLEPYDFYRVDGNCLMAMEYFPGTALAARPAPDNCTDDARAIWRKLAGVLGYLHERKIVHGDIKPENVLVDGDRIKLIDLGLSRPAKDWKNAASFSGTLAYAAPELLEGLTERTPATDVYALGLMIWVMTGNKLPDIRCRLDERSAWLNDWNRSLPERQAEVLLMMLRPEPWQRYDNGVALAEAMDDAGLNVEQCFADDCGVTGRAGTVRALCRLVLREGEKIVGIKAGPGSGATSLLKRLNTVFQKIGQDSIYVPADHLNPDQFKIPGLPKGAIILADGIDQETYRWLSPFRENGAAIIFTCNCRFPEAVENAGARLEIGALELSDIEKLIYGTLGRISGHDLKLLAGFVFETAGGNPKQVRQFITGQIASRALYHCDGRWRIDWERMLSARGIPGEPGKQRLEALRRLWEKAEQSANAGAMMYYGRLLCESGLIPAPERKQYAGKLMQLYHRAGDAEKALGLWHEFENDYGNSPDYYLRLSKLCNRAGEGERAKLALLKAKETAADAGTEDNQRLKAYETWQSIDVDAATSVNALKKMIEAEPGGSLAAYEIKEYIINLCWKLQDWSGVIGAAEQAVLSRPPSVSDYDHGMLMSQLGYAYWQTGEIEKAQAMLDKALPLLDDGMDGSGLADIYRTLALIGISKHEWKTAEARLQTAAQAVPRHYDPGFRALLCSTLSIANANACQYLRARDNNYLAASLYARCGDHAGQAVALANAASMEDLLGNSQWARKILHRCRGLAREEHDFREYGIVLKDLVMIDLAQEKWGDAWNAYLVYCGYAAKHHAGFQREAEIAGATAALMLGLFDEAGNIISRTEQQAGTGHDRDDAALLTGARSALRQPGSGGLKQMLAAGDSMQRNGRELDSARARLLAGIIAVRQGAGSADRIVLDGLYQAEAFFALRGIPALLERTRCLLLDIGRRLHAEGLACVNAELAGGFFRLSEHIGKFPDDGAVADSALKLAVELLGAERGGLFLLDEHNQLRLAAQVNLDPETARDAREYSEDAVLRAARDAEQIVCNDTELDELFKSRMSVQKNEIRSLLCAPVRYREGDIGSLYLDSRLKSGIFSIQRLEFFKTWCAIIGSLIESNRLMARLKQETQTLRSEEPEAVKRMIGVSESARKIIAEIKTIAATDVLVLITGESGTGKELAAKAIHALSRRRDRTFLTLDCGSLPGSLLEAELFGYVRGAFTGAYADKKGLFEAADQGTVFLDEITSANMDVQSKLLRVIETGQIRRVGDTAARRVDIRLICATNKNMNAEVNAGRFKEDLYYRLDVLRLNLPPLRERGDDILILAEHFRNKFQAEFGKKKLKFGAQARAAMLNHAWPGNIRELENVIKRAVIYADSNIITPEHLSLVAGMIMPAGIRQEAEMDRRNKVANALKAAGNNKTKAAKLLGITRRQVHRLINKYGIK